jgi:hypothetical protein
VGILAGRVTVVSAYVNDPRVTERDNGYTVELRSELLGVRTGLVQPAGRHWAASWLTGDPQTRVVETADQAIHSLIGDPQ